MPRDSVDFAWTGCEGFVETGCEDFVGTDCEHFVSDFYGVVPTCFAYCGDSWLADCSVSHAGSLCALLVKDVIRVNSVFDGSFA